MKLTMLGFGVWAGWHLHQRSALAEKRRAVAYQMGKLEGILHATQVMREGLA